MTAPVPPTAPSRTAVPADLTAPVGPVDGPSAPNN